MHTLLLALMLPMQQPPSQGQAVTIQLSTRWHPTVAIETGLSKLAFVAITRTPDDSGGNFFAVDSSGSIAELVYENREWKVRDRFTAGEPVVTGCAAAMRSDQVWSLIVGTAFGKVMELRRGDMGWGRHEIATVTAPLRAIRATEPGLPGPSQVVVIDGQGEVTNWYVGVSGRWHSKSLPNTAGGATHVCFDQSNLALTAVTAGQRGIIHKFVQDSMGDWSGAAWDTMSSGCADLAASVDPTKKDICIYYSGKDGHLRYLFAGRQDDVTSRLKCAEGAYQLIGKGDQRRFNEFFGMVGDEFCLFEYDPGLLEWIKVPIRAIPAKVVSTTFGPARGVTAWHTMYAATVDGKIYEFERDGLENQ